MFRRVRTENDIRGYTFTGVIFLYGWRSNRYVEDAFYKLEHRQPELFKEL